jgi:hypothetical protein
MFSRIIVFATMVVLINPTPALRLARVIRSPATTVAIFVCIAMAVPRILRFTSVVVRPSMAVGLARRVGPTGTC